MPEQAVLIEWNVEPSTDFLFQAEDQLSTVIAAEPTLGEVDGNDVGSGAATIYLYGPDCESLWEAIELTVRAFNPAPASVTVRPGGPETQGRRFNL